MCTWLLLFVNLVPISLMISLEVVKYFQAMFMQMDQHMFDQEQYQGMRAQASNLNEELGQVQYVFSDKTGTLTQNVMLFRKFTAGTQDYGSDLPLDQSEKDNQEENVYFKDRR